MSDRPPDAAPKSSISNRTPKRVLLEKEEPTSKKSAPLFSTPSSTSTSGTSFAIVGQLDVQTNMFALNIDKMPDKIERVHVDTIIKCSNGKECALNNGLLVTSGDVNAHYRRLAQCTILKKLHEQQRELFGGHSYHSVAYDSRATIYVPEGVYVGDEKETSSFKKEDFTSYEWTNVSKLCRRKDDTFVITLRPAGFIFAKGEKAMEPSNRLELTRCVEIVTSQKLNNSDFYQFGNATYPIRSAPKSEPDSMSQIRAGFAKSARFVQGREGKHEIMMKIDTKLSPFYKECTVLEFIVAKYAESKGYGNSGYGGEVSGGKRSYGSNHRDSRDGGSGYRSGRSQSSQPQDKDIVEVAEALNNDGSLLRLIEDSLKGLYVKPIHLKDYMNFIRITGVKENNATNTLFLKKDEKGEREISVEDYYHQQYNMKLKYPNLPLVISKRFKSECFFPMELLTIISGQRIKLQKMTPAVQSAMTGRNATLPKQHVELVQNILHDSLQLKKNRYLEAFGIELETTKPVHLKAKLLSPAQIRFKDLSYNPQLSRPAFRTNGKFVDPASIRKIAVIVFDRALEKRISEDFCDYLHRFCRENGMKVDQPSREWSLQYLSSDDNAGIKSTMERWLGKNVDILVAITKEKKPEVHNLLKYYEESVGLQTIQLSKQSVDKMMGQGGKQTTDNIMRKFNLKCGGTNFFVEIPSSVAGKSICSTTAMIKKLLEDVQFVGLEISHGASRSLYDRSRIQFDGVPSVVGVSYSMTHSTQLGGFTYLQTEKEYKLQKLDSTFPKCINAYNEHAKKLPSKIVIYRVGAGEGDFKRVMEEVNEIRASFETIQPGYSPQLVVILAQRASHTRVFPSRIEGQKPGEQNVPSGTCIDNVITSFGYDEFILSSQIPLIGTVRPCKYTVLVNEPGWSKNELMHLTYFRAFGHQVSYQPPSVPDVLYAAENLAKRGAANYKVALRYVNLQAVERHVIAAHADLINEEMREQLAAAMVDEISLDMNKMTIAKRNFWA